MQNAGEVSNDMRYGRLAILCADIGLAVLLLSIPIFGVFPSILAGNGGLTFIGNVITFGVCRVSKLVILAVPFLLYLILIRIKTPKQATLAVCVAGFVLYISFQLITSRYSLNTDILGGGSVKTYYVQYVVATMVLALYFGLFREKLILLLKIWLFYAWFMFAAFLTSGAVQELLANYRTGRFAIQDVNSMGMALVVFPLSLICYLWAFIPESKDNGKFAKMQYYLRLANASVGTFFLVCGFASGSRGLTIAYCISLLVLAMLVNKQKRKIFILVFVMVFIVGYTLSSNNVLQDRYANSTSDTPRNEMYADISKSSLALFGNGAGSYSGNIGAQDYCYIHNLELELIYEHGIFSLILFLVILKLIFSNLKRNWTPERSTFALVALSVFTLVYMQFSFTLLMDHYFWIAMMLSFGFCLQPHQNKIYT